MTPVGQLTPSKTSEILRQIGHSPSRKLGQNFLIDSNIVRKSLELAGVASGDLVVEVGPGLGTLTGALLAAGAEVYAVELDKKLFGYISGEFAGAPGLHIMQGDAVEFPRAGLPENAPDFKVVANLPYAISTPWLDKILSGPLPKTMSLMLQKEAASRFCAKKSDRDFSPISIFLNSAYGISGSHRVSASCFHPRPGVDSALLALERLENPYVFCPRAKEAVRKIFSRRRKQISSIARDLGDAAVLEWLESPGAPSPESRPETVPPSQWRELDAIFRKEPGADCANSI